METLGDRLRRARKAMGLRQHHVARAMGVSDSAINQWENNHTKPTLERVMTVAQFLRTSAEWLLDGGERGPMDDDEWRLLAAFRRMPARQRAATLEVVAPLHEQHAPVEAAEPPPGHTGAFEPAPPRPVAMPSRPRSSNKMLRKK